MKTWPRLAVLFALALSVPALAAETAPAPDAIVESPAKPAADAAAGAQPAAEAPAVRKPSRRLTPLQVAMAGVLESEKASMVTLKARLAAAKDPAAIEAAHREIEQLKVDTEVQLLVLQATHHRQNGRTELAAQLEESIRALRATQGQPAEPARAPQAPATNRAR